MSSLASVKPALAASFQHIGHMGDQLACPIFCTSEIVNVTRKVN
jgi:hypothetical protein